MKKTYFPGLNTLRLFAALSVVLGHAVDSLPYHPSASSKFVLDFFIMSGYDAVSLFFVLSGFLITYLLLVEKRETGDISVKDFLIRRCLRIWPLYFLVILLTVITTPLLVLPSASTFVAVLLFSPHVVQPQYLGGFGHFWSIGVEEWFYLVWPFLMRRFKLIYLIAAVIVVRLFIAGVLFPQLLIVGDRYVDPLHIFIHQTRFDAMAIGALGAYLLFHRHWTLRIIYRLQLLFIGFFILVIALPLEGGILFDMIFEFMFMGLILNVATNPHSMLRLENPLFRRLGQVTYGIYLYQLLTVQSTNWLMEWLGVSGTGGDLLFFTVLTAFTIVVALISYQYFELPFLRLKPSRRASRPATASAS